MGIRVDSAEQVQAYRARLESAGIPTLEEKEVVCCHALQDKIWAEDPTGYRWEVYVFKGDVDEAENKRSAAAEKMCACQ